MLRELSRGLKLKGSPWRNWFEEVLTLTSRKLEDDGAPMLVEALGDIRDVQLRRSEPGRHWCTQQRLAEIVLSLMISVIVLAPHQPMALQRELLRGLALHLAGSYLPILLPGSEPWAEPQTDRVENPLMQGAREVPLENPHGDLAQQVLIVRKSGPNVARELCLDVVRP
jgi:hypothetical protein